MISQSITQAFNASFTVVTTLAAMIMLSWPLTILSLVMVGVTLLATTKAARKETPVI
jgi:ATP-binding cassette subfamily B protein